jgi:hypothetical protein
MKRPSEQQQPWSRKETRQEEETRFSTYREKERFAIVQEVTIRGGTYRVQLMQYAKPGCRL